MSKSELEREFEFYFDALAPLDMPRPQREYRFAAHHVGGPGRGVRSRLKEAGLRDWRFDFAWPSEKVATELEGGTWSRGAHVRGKRYAQDCEKYNAACDLGWSVYRFTTDMLTNDPEGCIEQVVAALEGKERLPFDDVGRE